jgi:hypothetical protein
MLLPYVNIEGPGVVLGPGGEPLPGTGTARQSRSGIADLSLGASYSIPAEALGGADLTLGARVKLPTSPRGASSAPAKRT